MEYYGIWDSNIYDFLMPNGVLFYTMHHRLACLQKERFDRDDNNDEYESLLEVRVIFRY
jgi:hypothetical protein